MMMRANSLPPSSLRKQGLTCPYLAPLAGRGRILRAAKNPGEGESPRVQLSPFLRQQPLTPTLSPQARGEGADRNARRY
jgi:hypothetical protein